MYHTHDDCSSLNRTEELVFGSVTEAIASSRSRLCYYCAHKDGLEFLLEDPVDPAKVTEYLNTHSVTEVIDDAVETVTETVDETVKTTDAGTDGAAGTEETPDLNIVDQQEEGADNAA